MRETNMGPEGRDFKVPEENKPKSKFKKMVGNATRIAALGAASVGLYKAPEIVHPFQGAATETEQQIKESKEVRKGVGIIKDIVHQRSGGSLDVAPGRLTAADLMYPEEYQLWVDVNGVHTGVIHIKPDEQDPFKIGDSLKITYRALGITSPQGEDVEITDYEK